MVYSESKSKRSNYDGLEWFYNVPFSYVKEEMINQIRDRDYAYDSYLKWTELISQLSNIWNVALLDSNKKVYMFAYGFWNPLDSELEIKRAIVCKEFYSIKGDLLVEGLDRIKELANKLGLKYIYWLTNRPEVFLRKMSGAIKKTNIVALEVL